jgi:hypothetical protein
LFQGARALSLREAPAVFANWHQEEPMRAWPIFLFLLSTLLSPVAVRAQETVDAAKITCNQFMFGRIADSRTISIWLIGYYSGMRNNSVIDTALVQKQSQELVQYCMAHSEASVMDAAKIVFNVSK